MALRTCAARFSAFSTVLVLVFLSLQGAGSPNIVILCADQMRSSAMACMGNGVVKTPNLDLLAAEGLLFQNAISATPQCTAFRASLLTGRYGHNTGITSNDLRLPHEETTLAEILRDHGYRTGFIGKWHLSSGRRAAAGTPERQGFVPPGADRQGFDYWAALECSHNYFKTRYFRDTPKPIAITTYEPEVQTDLALDFLRDNKDSPFLLVLMWGPPHSPYKPPEEWDIYDPDDVDVHPNVPAQLEKKARSELAQYYGLVSSLDAQVGRIRKGLQDLGLEKDTIVLFTSDHGDMLRSHGFTRKGRPQSEALMIPFVLRYPAAVPAGRKITQPICSVDVLPTLLAFCGIEIPGNVDGRNLQQALINGWSDKENGNLETAFAESNLQSLHNSPGTPWRAVVSDRFTYAITSEGDWLLFDNLADPYQLNNLVSDPAHQSVLVKMRDQMQQWRTRTGDNAILEGPKAN